MAARAATAMRAVGTSTIARRPSTNAAPAMAPEAAAVTPSTKPLMTTFLAYFRKYGAGPTTSR